MVLIEKSQNDEKSLKQNAGDLNGEEVEKYSDTFGICGFTINVFAAKIFLISFDDIIEPCGIVTCCNSDNLTGSSQCGWFLDK